MCVCDIVQTPDDSTLSAGSVDRGGRGLQVGVTGQPLGGI